MLQHNDITWYNIILIWSFCDPISFNAQIGFTRGIIIIPNGFFLKGIEKIAIKVIFEINKSTNILSKASICMIATK